MASISILGSLEAEQILRAVPPNLRELVRMTTRQGQRYHVILFGHNQDHGSVNTSAVVRRALRHVPADAHVLAVGRDFTQEATELLNERGAAIARATTFGWTDASFIHLHDRV